jgi:type I restriction enzyme S subunit
MDLRPGYQETEIGVIPEDWKVSRLGSHVAFKTGPFGSALHKSDYVDGGVPVVNPMQIVAGKIEPTHTMAITEQAARKLADFRLSAGNIVIGRRGEMGRCAFVGKEQEGWLCGTGSMIIRTTPSIDGRFLQRVLSSPTVIAAIENASVGTTMVNLNQGTLGNLVVALPPTKAEQEAIAEALSDADALIEAVAQLIAKKRMIKQGAMQELLTGRKRLPGFRGEWASAPMGEIASPTSEKNIGMEKLPVLTCSKHLGFVDSLGYFKNQVFSKDTSTYKIIRRGEIGYPSNHVEEGSIGLQNLYDVALVSPIYVVFSVREGVNNEFLHRVLKQDSYRHRFKTATTSSVDRRGSLRWPAFSQITISLPAIEEQTAIATIFCDIDAEIAALEMKLAKYRQLKQGTMHKLLTGKIRLIDANTAKVEQLSEENAASPKRARAHTWAFNEAIVISVLVDQFGEPAFPLGRKRYTKLAYLMHRKAERQVQGYLKKAAGPYNPKTKYAGPERIALENSYVRRHESGKFKGFVAAEKIEQAKTYFAKWYGPTITAWLEQFRFKSNDELERLATVDMAMQELLTQDKTAEDVDSVRALIASEPDWLPKLNRSAFSDSRIAEAIAKCRELFR